ncbi:MAG: peroxide stress protein YaaA [Nocardioidaceae bacterium]|nr:peroxide stress protein YaaA [Nocardioidaceae bacterium]
MLIWLPPSEGKTLPVRGRSLDLDALASPSLTDTRRTLVDALVDLASQDPTKAAEVLGLGPTQADAVARDARLWDLPTARADRVYSGVLFAALDLASLEGSARRRATSRLAVASALFGVVRPGDRIPAYRLSGGTSLPGVGPVAAAWRAPLAAEVPALVGSGLLVDLRSSTYAALFRPGRDLAPRTATVRVLQEKDGRRSIVSHFNKATKGAIARALLVEDVDVRRVDALADALRDLGWTVEQEGTRLDVVVTET